MLDNVSAININTVCVEPKSNSTALKMVDEKINNYCLSSNLMKSAGLALVRSINQTLCFQTTQSLWIWVTLTTLATRLPVDPTLDVWSHHNMQLPARACLATVEYHLSASQSVLSARSVLRHRPALTRSVWTRVPAPVVSTVTASSWTTTLCAAALPATLATPSLAASYLLQVCFWSALLK